MFKGIGDGTEFNYIKSGTLRYSNKTFIEDSPFAAGIVDGLIIIIVWASCTIMGPVRGDMDFIRTTVAIQIRMIHGADIRARIFIYMGVKHIPGFISAD